MKIGIDLDHTAYGYPEFFKSFIEAMTANGHEIYCTSNHGKDSWEKKHVPKLIKLGIDPSLINTSLMAETKQVLAKKGLANKVRMSKHVDVVFDDHAKKINPHTTTPVFETPKAKAIDRKRK